MIECVACLPRGMLSVACLPRGMLSVACHVAVLSHCRGTSVGRYCASSVALLSNGLGRTARLLDYSFGTLHCQSDE